MLLSPMLCLNMIVKNESKVIARCLESVKPVVDAWVIVDTGSTDGTQEIVRSVMSDLPGDLYERPWRDFAHNRNEAMALARDRGDYLFVVDADDVIEVARGFVKPSLSADSYYVRVEYGDTVYYRLHIFRADRGFRYEGVLHEVLVSDVPRTSGRIEGLVYRCAGGGSRSADPDKFRKDAAVLEKAIRDNPANARNVFYLAQSWRDCGELEKALDTYEQRVAMGGWEEEVFCSLQEIGRLTARLQRGDAAVVAAFLRAYEYRPRRAEPLCSVAAYLRERGRPGAAYPSPASRRRRRSRATSSSWTRPYMLGGRSTSMPSPRIGRSTTRRPSERTSASWPAMRSPKESVLASRETWSSHSTRSVARQAEDWLTVTAIAPPLRRRRLRRPPMRRESAR